MAKPIQHSAGPWTAVKRADNLWGVEFDNGTGQIVLLDRREDGHANYRAATEADAKLIAVAPRMLECVRTMASFGGERAVAILRELGEME